MKIDQLIYFAETARQEHIGKASKILGISPSAISHSIRSLEGELGLELFQKKGKFITLTDEGRKLLEKSGELVNAFQNLKYDLLNETDDNTYYKFAAAHTLSFLWVTKAWSQLHKDYSKTTLDLLTLRSSEVLKGVLSKEFDLGVAFSPQEHPDLEYRLIHQGELLIVVRKNHPLLKEKINKRLELLSQYPAVLPKAFQGIDICIQNPMFKKFNISINPETLTDSYDVALNLITDSNYWGLVPDIFIDPKKFAIVKPKSGWNAKYHICAIWLKKRFIPKFFNDFCQKLQEAFKKI